MLVSGRTMVQTTDSRLPLVPLLLAPAMFGQLFSSCTEHEKLFHHSGVHLYHIPVPVGTYLAPIRQASKFGCGLPTSFRLLGS